ncbi:ANTAR domain-containing protein [Streptomyces sp. NPDC002701]|uniref:ANTAR domain-containing protein n=1 Tax=Streptomyces sp. NPDC002701 TaxID=3364661 RepID=UPI00368F003C
MERLERLQGENAQLQEAVHAHAVVDQAIGVVIVLGRLTPVQGWEVLRAVSQRTNIKLRQVAEHVVAFARTGQLGAAIRKELERQLEHVQPGGRPDSAG